MAANSETSVLAGPRRERQSYLEDAGQGGEAFAFLSPQALGRSPAPGAD